MNLPVQLGLADNILIALALIGLYSIILRPLQNSETWKRRGITAGGFQGFPLFLFMRTQRGLSLLDRLSRPRRFWRAVASAGVPMVVLSMCYFLLLVLLMTYIMIREPPQPSSYNAPRNILLIPGLNEYIPFVWGWIALFVTMVVHEFAHGILSRVEGVRVKSMGIVTFMIAPIAAFVEPDEEELFGGRDRPPLVSKGARIRILSAGVISNFVVAAVAMALFFGPVLGSIDPVERVVVVDVAEGSPAEWAGFESGMVVLQVDGRDVGSLQQLVSDQSGPDADIQILHDGREQVLRLTGEPEQGILVASVFEGSPAERSGLPAKSVITKIDGMKTPDLKSFRERMNSTRPGQVITITTSLGDEYRVNLTSKESIGEYDADGGAGFIGIGISGDALYWGGAIFQEPSARQFLQVLKEIPSRGLAGFHLLLSLPFSGITGFAEKGFPGFSGWLTAVFEPTGWAEPLGSRFFWIANLLLWIGWINLYAGLFNCLPSGPLDGGHIFRDLLQVGFERVVAPAEAERLSRTAAALFTWLVLTSLLITLIAPFTNWFSI